MLTFRVISDLQQKVNNFLFMSIVTLMDLASNFQKYPKFPGKRGRWMLDQVVQYKNSSNMFIFQLNSSKDDFQTVGKNRKYFLSD